MPARDVIDLKCPSALVSSYCMKRVSDHAFAYCLCLKVKLMQRDSCHVYVIRPKSKLLRQRLDFLPCILQSYFSGLSTHSRIEGTCKESFSAKVSKSNFLVQNTVLTVDTPPKLLPPPPFRSAETKVPIAELPPCAFSSNYGETQSVGHLKSIDFMVKYLDI